MGSHIKLVSQSAALTKFIIGIKCNSISIAAITMRVVMIVTLHQHGFPTRSILQKRQKIERRFKSQGRRDAAQSRPPLVAMVSGVRRYRDRCPCQWRWRWRWPETPPGTPIAASAALGRSMGAASRACWNTHGVRWGCFLAGGATDDDFLHISMPHWISYFKWWWLWVRGNR